MRPNRGHLGLYVRTEPYKKITYKGSIKGVTPSLDLRIQFMARLSVLGPVV